jgi:hypothetical protein
VQNLVESIRLSNYANLLESWKPLEQVREIKTREGNEQNETLIYWYSKGVMAMPRAPVHDNSDLQAADDDDDDTVDLTTLPPGWK